jgi:hypothetical protein
MEAQGWCFLPENRRWDADDREAIARATGLAALTPTGWLAESDAWFKAFARAYARSRDLNLALSECAGLDSDAHDEPGIGVRRDGVGSRMLTAEEIADLRRGARETLEPCRAVFREHSL